MKLYRINTVNGPRWYGTQADAKAGAKQLGTEYSQVDVPVDKPNLLKWLNEHMARDNPEPAGIAPALDPLQAAELSAVHLQRLHAIADQPQAVPIISADNPQLTADSIVSFILDHATVAQAETVFAALGTRFKESINAAR